MGFNTHGWAYNFISPGLARNHHAHPRPAARTPPASNASARPSHRPAPGPAMARPSPRTGPHTARPARLHDAQPRFHSTHRIRRRNTASPQVAPHALHSGPQIAPARHGPAPLTRITHGPNWGNPFVTHFIDLSHGVKGYSYKWVARLTRLQEPPSPSRSEVTARLRPGSRMQTPGGTHAEL